MTRKSISWIQKGQSKIANLFKDTFLGLPPDVKLLVNSNEDSARFGEQGNVILSYPSGCDHVLITIFFGG